MLATFLPLFTALATLFTLANVVLALLILPFLPLNLLAFTAAMPAFTALEYFDTLRFTAGLNAGLAIAVSTCRVGKTVALKTASSIACCTAMRSAAPRTAAASNNCCPGCVANAPNPNAVPATSGLAAAVLATTGAALAAPTPAYCIPLFAAYAANLAEFLAPTAAPVL